MAIRWMDNFNIYGTDAGNQNRMLNGVYASINGDGFGGCNLTVDPDGISTGLVLNIPPSYGGGGAYNGVRKVLPVASLTQGMACRLWLAALPNNVSQVPAPICFKDGANNFIYCLCVTPTGRLEIRAGGTGGAVLASTPNPVLTANAWTHIEMKMLMNAGAGTAEVRIEGISVINNAALNTGATAVAQVSMVNDPDATSQSVNMFVKDLIVWDNTGAFNNDFMGTCQVLKISPDADVALNWTPFPADGVGYNKINLATPLDDASYISAPSPAPAAYKCSLSDLPAKVTSVRGVMPIHRSKKTDGGDGNIQQGLISAGVTGVGVDRPITTAYTYWWDIFDADPNGNIGWTRAAVNALDWQGNRTV